MITFNLKPSLTLLITGFLIGFLLSLLFNGCGNDSTVPHQEITSAENLKKEATSKEAVFQKKITELETKNQLLQNELKAIKQQLASVKVKTKQRENTIKKIIEPKGFLAKELLKKVKPAVTVDTSLSPCDSLAKEVSEYIHENALKDSLYETQISTLDSMVARKDSVIRFKTELHSEWIDVFTKALDQQEILQNQNNQLRKQFKRQKLKSKLVTVGLMILSGAAANYLLHR